jgi:hypothetical protein
MGSSLLKGGGSFLFIWGVSGPDIFPYDLPYVIHFRGLYTLLGIRRSRTLPSYLYLRVTPVGPRIG